MEIRLSPEAEQILAEPHAEVDAWSPEKCRLIAGIARDFKPLMSSDGRRAALEGVARHLERQAAAEQAGTQRP